jgi:hypothetical protein
LVRADPKTETPRLTQASVSKPSTNSPRMRRARHESECRKASGGGGGVCKSFSSSVSDPDAPPLAASPFFAATPFAASPFFVASPLAAWPFFAALVRPLAPSRVAAATTRSARALPSARCPRSSSRDSVSAR